MKSPFLLLFTLGIILFLSATAPVSAADAPDCPPGPCDPGQCDPGQCDPGGGGPGDGGMGHDDDEDDEKKKKKTTIDEEIIDGGDDEGGSGGGGGEDPNWTRPSADANSNQQTITLFGTIFSWNSGNTFHGYDQASEAEYWGWNDNYSNGSGDGSLHITYTTYGGSTGSYFVSGWDPYLGSFSDSDATSLSFTWDGRSSPSFAPGAFWLNGSVVSWQSSALSSDGTLTDTYSGGVTIAGNRRSFQTQGGSASLFVNGASIGSLNTSGFSLSSGWDAQTSDPNRSTPFFCGSTLWVSNSAYQFTGGFEDSGGTRLDTYVCVSLGSVTLVGSSSNQNLAAVVATYYGSSYSGDFSNGSFNVGGIDIKTSNSVDDTTTGGDTTGGDTTGGDTTGGDTTGGDTTGGDTTGGDTTGGDTTGDDTTTTTQTIYGPDAFWMRGRFYQRTSSTQNHFVANDGSVIDLTGADPLASAFTGTAATAALAVSGTFDASGTGMFIVLQTSNGLPVPVWPANANGTLSLAAGGPASADIPPAIMVANGTIWQYLGAAADEDSPGTNAAYYGSASNVNNATPSTGGGCVIKLRLDGSGTVTLTNYLANTAHTGSYSTQTHLFQTSAGSGLPVPMMGVDPQNNNAAWNLLTPPADLPASFLVHGQVWHYSGTDGNGNALYQGYYTGQQMSLDAADASGQRLVTVTDPVNGGTTGILNNLRGSVRLRNGVMVYSGNYDGSLIAHSNSNSKLQTIGADLDITGNIISFGALLGDAEAAGVTMQFSDDGLTATLGSALGRPLAQWLWTRASAAGIAQAVPITAMQLDPANKLKLFDAASNAVGVVIDPSADGTSSIPGVLRVRPGGDIPMGDFTAGGQP